jgi:single-strand DNA-binding protein
MSNFQQTIVIGRVGKDAEMRYTGSGQAVTAFSVAVSKQYKNAAGEQVKNTNWFRVSAWGKSAEICNQYVKKGMLVQVV